MNSPDARFKRTSIAKSITIRGVNRGKRRSKYYWNVREHWSEICFSDETQVVIGKNKKRYMWRRSHETVMLQWLGQYCDKYGQSALFVLFWGCITYKGVGKLVPVEGNMNSEKHINVLDESLWPVVTKHFPTDRWTLHKGTTRHVMSRTDHPVEKRQPHSHSSLATTEP